MTARRARSVAAARGGPLDAAALARLPVCSDCGKAGAVAFRPGAEGNIVMILGQPVPVVADKPMVAWCLDCWPAWGRRDEQAV